MLNVNQPDAGLPPGNNLFLLLILDKTNRHELIYFKAEFIENGRDFLNRLSLLSERTQKSYLRKINDVIVAVVPQLDELSFVKVNLGTPHIEARYKHWRKSDSKQDETAFSFIKSIWNPQSA